MKHFFYFMLVALPCAFTISAVAAFAQPQQSENFRITKSVLDAGGGVGTSTNFRLVSSFGQPTPVGLSSSANFVLSAGFLSPTFAASPLSPIADLVVKRGAGPASDVQLNWSVVTGAASYTIYRDATPTFTPGPSNQVGTSSTNNYTDLNAVGLPGTHYYYIVTSTNGNVPMARAPGGGVEKQAPASARATSKQKAESPKSQYRSAQ